MTATRARRRFRKPPRVATHPHVAKALVYAKNVIAGRLPACRWVRLACQRHLSDLKRAKSAAYPYRFDASLAERRCEFEELLPHVKGHWAIPVLGNPAANLLRLEPWQCFERIVLFGWVEKGTGFRRFQVAYREIPRKNSKSTGAAVDGLFCFTADGEFGAECYSGATTEKQAWEVFRPARLMAERTTAFREYYGIQVNASNLAIERLGNRFEPIIGKPGDGASPSCAIVDEYHEHLDSTLYDTMLTGMAARRQPLMNVITTAGDNIAGPCYALRDRVTKMLDGTLPDERLFGVIYTIDEGDSWTSEAALRKANPNFGVSVGAEWLRKQQQDAIANGRQQGVFKTKHLNVWVTAREAWMNMEWWNRQADESLQPSAFAGDPCFGGVDLSSKLDIASSCRVFRRTLEDGPPDEDGDPTPRPHYYAFWRHYLPAAMVEDPKNQHYQDWAYRGLLTVTEGDMIDEVTIRDDLFADGREHGYQEVAFDEWGASRMILECQAEGIQAVPVPQTTKYLSEPLKSVEALVKSGQFHHNGDQVATWAISNVTCREDANENIFPRKERKENKIDPASALFVAMSRALVTAVTEPRIRSLG